MSPLACRTATYKELEPQVLERLADFGVRAIETRVPPPGAAAELRARLDRLGLRAVTLHAECPVSRPNLAERIAAAMPAFEELGAHYLLAATRSDGTALPVVHDRLRAAGDAAGRHGVTIIVETHPDLATNAKVAAQTMLGVNHPHVRINFDTANVYFYNSPQERIDLLREYGHRAPEAASAADYGVAELRAVLKYVGGLHLKDTDGGYRHWHFPAFGRGIVDFSRTLALLSEQGFDGPLTIEIEGLEGEEKSLTQACERLAESVAYLRRLKPSL
jgi:sugar phosphate isomerase/epimerase